MTTLHDVAQIGWRAVRIHFLPMGELGKLNDLTVGEMSAILKLQMLNKADQQADMATMLREMVAQRGAGVMKGCGDPNCPGCSTAVPTPTPAQGTGGYV